MAERLVLPETIETLPGAIAWWAARTPDAPALQSLDRPAVSYAELLSHVNAAGIWLATRGMARGDRVALAADDGIDATVALVALMGSVMAAPLCPLLPASHLRRDLERLDARLLLSGTGDEAVGAVAAEFGVPALPVAGMLEHCAQERSARCAHRNDDSRATDVMLIAHTSGTTALPKRVPISHRMQLAAARARNRLRGIGPDDVGLLLAPGSTVMFLTNLITMLAAGGSAIMLPTLDPVRALRAHAELLPTWILAGGPLLAAIVDQRPRHRELFENRRLRVVSWGGAGADARLAARLTDAFGVPCDGTYGMSEASAIATPSPPASGPLGSAGVPAAAEVRIVDERGATRVSGEAGEVVVRGPSVFGGYLDDPDATSAAFTPDGWFRTGDLGYLDAEGRLFLTGRLKEQINRGGIKIAPEEVVSALLCHPAVGEAAVFAITDATYGEDAAAAVVLAPGAQTTPRELRVWLLDRLPLPKVPRRIWFVASLPRTASGKVRRAELSHRFARAEGLRAAREDTILLQGTCRGEEYP